MRATSARWAWVEYVLAQGGEAEGLAVIDAVDAGGSFRAYEQAFARVAPAAATQPDPGARRSLPLTAR